MLYGVDWDSPPEERSTENENQTVLVGDIGSPFTREQMILLESQVDIFSESLSFGCDIYLKALELIREN